jgi:2-haloacid dehalogenase
MVAVALDINETLLDLAGLDPLFADLFDGDGREQRRTWFQRMLHAALSLTAAGGYEKFGALGAAALRDLAAERGTDLPGDATDRLATGLRSLPPHPDVVPALRRLRNAGVASTALSNSTPEVAAAQITNAGLRELVGGVVAADEVGVLKPSARPYALAAERLGVPLSELWLVAAHDWDVVGARMAGAHAAFLARPGQRPPIFGPAPDLVATDLDAVVTALLAP